MCMKWVTRQRPQVDRIACPWLIQRFVDSDAELLFAPADEVLAVAQREAEMPLHDALYAWCQRQAGREMSSSTTRLAAPTELRT